MPRTSLRNAVAGLAVLVAVGLGAASQQAPNRSTRDTSDDGRAHAEEALVESMSSHHMHDNAHLRLTAKRPERPGDRQRATAIVAALRPALERYRDYQVALQNGYRIFMPQVPQSVYHFTNYLEGFAERFRFQPDHATSLLYRKTRTGYELGADAAVQDPAERCQFRDGAVCAGVRRQAILRRAAARTVAVGNGGRQLARVAEAIGIGGTPSD